MGDSSGAATGQTDAGGESEAVIKTSRRKAKLDS
jgi:hypothetical protein